MSAVPTDNPKSNNPNSFQVPQQAPPLQQHAPTGEPIMPIYQSSVPLANPMHDSPEQSQSNPRNHRRPHNQNEQRTLNTHNNNDIEAQPIYNIYSEQQEEHASMQFPEEMKGSALSTKQIQLGFVKKVLFIVLLQMALTIGFIIPMILSQTYRDFYLDHFYIFYIMLVVNIVSGCSIVCCRRVARRVPTNYILLFIFTISMSYMLSAIAEAVDPVIVIGCFIATFSVVCLLFFYVVFAKDSIPLRILIIVLLLSITGLAIYFGVAHSRFVLDIIIGSLLIVLYTIVLYSKIQSIFKGTNWRYTIDDYVIAAMDIYTDVIYLFLLFICVSGRRRR